MLVILNAIRYVGLWHCHDMEVLRLIDDLRVYDLKINSVVITRYNDRPATSVFINKLERRNIKVYKHDH